MAHEISNASIRRSAKAPLGKWLRWDTDATMTLERRLSVPTRSARWITRSGTESISGSRSGTGAGFTVIELLTVAAILGILATLLLTGVAKARERANQVVCRNNLRQISYAVEMYSEEAKRRPRTLSRLIARPTWLSHEKALVCPDDPGLRRPPANIKPSQWTLWGNRANSTQEPMHFLDPKNPEAGTWEAELKETAETNRFSYLHPFTWQRAAFLRLGSGNQAGNAVCELHGLRVAQLQSEPSYTDYEGWTLRTQRDGSVISRKIFRARSPREGIGVNGDTLTVPLNREEYPWEFYLDTPPADR